VAPVEICDVTPIARPCESISGPPELPWLIAASVWIAWSIPSVFGASIVRCSALTTPVVSVRTKPNGLPIAYTGSPTVTRSELPSGSGVSARECASTFSTAVSVDGSWPTTVAVSWSRLEKETCTFEAPCTTW
jgi:hypothetical protein